LTDSITDSITNLCLAPQFIAGLFTFFWPQRTQRTQRNDRSLILDSRLSWAKESLPCLSRVYRGERSRRGIAAISFPVTPSAAEGSIKIHPRSSSQKSNNYGAGEHL